LDVENPLESQRIGWSGIVSSYLAQIGSLAQGI
jgi:hypothetical protein